MREKVGKNDDSKPFGGSREVASRTAENPKQCRSNEMVKRLPKDSEHSREWTGNDHGKVRGGGGDYHGRVRCNESPLNIRLNWKTNDDSPTKSIGTYQLDLTCLLKEKYIREDHGEVRLRFQRTGPDIQIAVNRKEHALTIGAFGTNP
jgi:hypothetical protein